MKVAEVIAEFVAVNLSPRVYGVCGAGAMHLNDAFANHPKLQVIAMQHEQAAAMAAEAETRVTGIPCCVLVTAGPGGTNAMTGVACAYVDSIPMFVIGGQVTKETITIYGGRQTGMNELPIADLMTTITKESSTLRVPDEVCSTLYDHLYLMKNGRKGPVFLEIPLDVQAAEVDYPIMSPPIYTMTYRGTHHSAEMWDELFTAKKPLVIIGNGVRLADAIDEFRKIFDVAGIPIVSSWGAADILPSDHPYYIGRMGIFGDRASNFAVQAADVILAIGARLSIGQIGHATKKFAPQAKKIVVDIDHREIEKHTIEPVHDGLNMNAKDFLSVEWLEVPNRYSKWTQHCQEMKYEYAPFGEAAKANRRVPCGISSYDAVAHIADQMADDAIVVTDVGFCFIPTFQSMELNGTQRLIHSAGVSPMGWGIPAAIGASLAGGGRQVICLTGDGGAMMNLQELQTIAHHRLPIAIFVYENDGYATMKIAQNNHFKREVMSGPKTGLTLPDFSKIARAFGITALEFDTIDGLTHSLEMIFDIASQGPVVVVMHMERQELIAPRLMARMENGKFIPADLSDMWPHLPPEERRANLGVGNDSDSFDGPRQKVLGTP